MTAALPLPEAPDDDVVDLLHLVEQARINLRLSRETVDRLVAADGTVERLPAAQLYYDVDRVVAKYRAELWDLVVGQLEASARAMGLQP